MKVEVLLSVLNLNKKNLNNMNIISKCTVINQCDKNNFEKYNNFDIYSYKERGTSVSRNRGLEHVSEDIILLCDDDVIYNKDYENIVINEFNKNSNADVIIFNFDNPYRKKRINKKIKRLHIYNILNYASYNIAFKRKNINNIKFNTSFGPGAKYKSGEDNLFLVDCLKNKLKIYSTDKFIGKINSNNSTWFNGYNEKYFYDRGAFLTEISPKFRYIIIFLYLLKNRNILTNYNFIDAYKIMLKGSKEYLYEKRN